MQCDLLLGNGIRLFHLAVAPRDPKRDQGLVGRDFIYIHTSRQLLLQGAGLDDPYGSLPTRDIL